MKNNKRNREKSQNYQNYSTNPAEFQTWLDKIYSRLNMPTIAATSVIGVTIYFIGLLIAATFDFGREYIDTSAIYIGIFGISLVASVVRYASTQIHSVFEYFRPCLIIDDKSYKLFITRWFSKLANNTGNYMVAGVYGVLALLVAYSEFFLSPLTGRVQYGSMKPYFFEYFWYQPEGLWNKVIIIAFYGLCVAFPLGTATRLLYLNFAFMKDLQKFPVIPLTNILRIRLRVVINYYLFIYFTWSIGIGLFGIVFFNGLNVDSIVFLSMLNILGIGAFIAPQLCYRSFVLANTKTLTNQVISDYYSNMQIHLDERTPTLPRSSDVVIESLNGRINWWIYDFSDILIFILAQIIIYGIAFLQ